MKVGDEVYCSKHPAPTLGIFSVPVLEVRSPLSHTVEPAPASWAVWVTVPWPWSRTKRLVSRLGYFLHRTPEEAEAAIVARLKKDLLTHERAVVRINNRIVAKRDVVHLRPDLA
jgi:hypothetical protein